VSLTLTAESLKTQTDGITFRCDCGAGRTLQCGITDIALRDLVGFHHLDSIDADAYGRVLLPEIERLANAKYEVGRLEEDGGLLIRSTDLVRFGFGSRKAGSRHTGSEDAQLQQSNRLIDDGSESDEELRRLRSLLSAVTGSEEANGRHPLRQWGI
jgi:hypothetical protein